MTVAIGLPPGIWLACQKAIHAGDAQLALEQANAEQDGYGVEAVIKHGDIIAQYVNMGETYQPTSLYDVTADRFYFISWGDFLEAWEHAHQDTADDLPF
jgi:hypothetical protein